MNPKTQAALLRAKSLLGAAGTADVDLPLLKAFDSVVAEARAYIQANGDIPDDCEISIELHKSDFSVQFERQ